MALDTGSLALAAAIVSLAASPDRLREMRGNTRWVEQFSASKVLSDFENKLLDIAHRGK